MAPESCRGSLDGAFKSGVGDPTAGPSVSIHLGWLCFQTMTSSTETVAEEIKRLQQNRAFPKSRVWLRRTGQAEWVTICGALPELVRVLPKAIDFAWKSGLKDLKTTRRVRLLFDHLAIGLAAFVRGDRTNA